MTDTDTEDETVKESSDDEIEEEETLHDMKSEIIQLAENDPEIGKHVSSVLSMLHNEEDENAGEGGN
jgi:hypothetical protein